MSKPNLDAIQARAEVVRRCYQAAPNDCYDMGDIDKAVEAQLADVPALLAYARDLEARIGRADEVVRSMDQRVKQNVRNIESGLYDETFTAVANGVNSFAESSVIAIRAALTATEARD